MAETFVPRPMEAEGGPQPRDPPMPGAGEARPKGPPVQVPTEDSAFISDRTLCELMDPSNINSGVLQDIYQLREDDFEEPQELEVWYMVGHQPQREFMFIDPLHSQERPRICVSVKAVQAMHRAIAVLTRKLDNVLVTLRTCREHYWKELTLLRELLYRKEHEKDKIADEHILAEHYAAFFNAAQYQDEVTVSLFKQRLEEATHDLDQKLQMKQAEIRKLYQRINKMEMGFDALDRVEQRDYEEQLQDLQCDFEALREEKEAREAELAEKDLEIKEHQKQIDDLREEVDLTRALVEKREAKHKQLLGLVEDEKVALEQRLNNERKEWNETKAALKKENERLTEELKDAQMTKETMQLNSTYNKIKLIRSKKRYSAEISEDTPQEAEEEPFRRAMTDGESRRSTLTSMPSHTTHLGARLSNPLENKAPSIMELLKGNVPTAINQPIQEGGESTDGSSSSSTAADKKAEQTRNFLEKVEERRRQTVAAREQLREEENQASQTNTEGSAAGEASTAVKQEPAAAEAAVKEPRRSLTCKEARRASNDLDMDEIEKLWAQVYKKPAAPRDEEPEMDPDELISLIVESVASLAKQGPAARKKAATALIVEMSLNELRAIRDTLDARAYAALNGLKEPIAAGVARLKAGKHGPPLKTPSASRAGSRRGSPLHSPAPSRRGSTKRSSISKGGTNLNLGYTPSPSNRNLRPQSAGGHRKDGNTSRPQSRNQRLTTKAPAANKRKTKKPGAAADDGAQGADATDIEDDAVELDEPRAIRRQSCPSAPPPEEKPDAVPDDAGFDMNAVNDLLLSHLEGQLPERKKLPADDGQSSSSGLSDGSFHYLDINITTNDGNRESIKSINDGERGSIKKDSPDDGIPVDELLSSWGVDRAKPHTADTESTRAPHSAGSVFGGLQDDVADDSPLARRVRHEQKQRELEKLRQLLADPRLGEPQKLERSLSVNKRSSEDDEEDNDWDEAAVHDGDTPPPSKALPRAKSLPVINLKGNRLLDQLDLLPDVYAINIGDGKSRRGSNRRRSTRKAGAPLYPSSGSSSPPSPGRKSVDSPRFSVKGKLKDISRAMSRRGSGTDSQYIVQRSHSLPPCWSMPMYADSSNYPELASMTTGLGRLLVGMVDLPPQHYRVCRELIQSGWVLNHPSGFAYEALGDPSEFEASSPDPAGQADSYLNSGTGTDVAQAAAGGSFLQTPDTMSAVPELMVRSLYSPAPAPPRGSKNRILTPATGMADAAAAPAGPNAGAADGDAAAGSTRPVFQQQWSARPGYEDSQSPGTAAAGAESFASSRRGANAVAAVAGRAISTVRRANALADSLAKGRLPFATPHPLVEEFGELQVAGHGVKVGKVDKASPVKRETTMQAVSTETQSDPSDNDAGAPARVGKSAMDVFARMGDSLRKLSHRPTTVNIEAPGQQTMGVLHKGQAQLAPPGPLSAEASQQFVYDPIPPAAGFALRRPGGGFSKAMRGNGFRVVAKELASARQQPGESLGLPASGDAMHPQPLHLLSLQVPKVKAKPRMVSVGTQTNLSVSSSRFEVMPDMDEPEGMKLRDTSRLVDKEELRLKIAKELLALCSELRDDVGVQDGQDKPAAGTGSGHVGQGLAQGLYSKNEMHFNQLGLGIAGLHRPMLPKSGQGLKSTFQLRNRKNMQARNLQAMQLLERGAIQKKTARPSLKSMVESDFHIEDPFNLKKQAQQEAQNNMKQFSFQVEGNSSGGEEEQVCTCGWQFASDESFCHHCGAQRPMKKRVHICACGNTFAPGAVFCRKCGAMRPMDALGGVGVAHHRHDEDEHDPGGQQLPSRSSQVTFQGKEEEQGGANKHSQATMSTVASDSSLIHSHGNPTMLEALATADQVAGHAQLPAINHSEQPGESPRKKHPSLTVQAMMTSPRPAAVVRQRPGSTSDSTNPAQLPRRKIDVNRIVNAMMEADDVGLVGDRRVASDEVVERSRQWIEHDRRQHGGPLTARPAGRPQTQGQQQRLRRPSETLPPVDAEDRWYPQQSQEDRLPLRALLKR